MDIQNASNLERFLYYLFHGDAKRLAGAMRQFADTGRLAFDATQLAEIGETFLATSVDNDQTLNTIRDFHKATGYVLDPHTATGVRAAKDLAGGDFPVICLATAHPAKFPDAVKRAIGENPERPASLIGLEERPRRCQVVAAKTSEIKSYLAEKAVSSKL
jgi:threonine synthase